MRGRQCSVAGCVDAARYRVLRTIEDTPTGTAHTGRHYTVELALMARLGEKCLSHARLESLARNRAAKKETLT